jgi:hypothetical protein
MLMAECVSGPVFASRCGVRGSIVRVSEGKLRERVIFARQDLLDPDTVCDPQLPFDNDDHECTRLGLNLRSPGPVVVEWAVVVDFTVKRDFDELLCTPLARSVDPDGLRMIGDLSSGSSYDGLQSVATGTQPEGICQFDDAYFCAHQRLSCVA